MSCRKFIITLFVASTLVVFAQPPHMQRTPEEVAMKQTEMLVRDLGITDSLVRDTLYKVHLHFARDRRPHPTPEEIRLHHDSLSQALQGILTPAQYQLLLNRQAKATPRYPQPPVNRFVPQSQDPCKMSSPDSTRREGPDMPPPPPGYLL